VPLTHRDRETILRGLAFNEEQRKALSEFIAGATFPLGTLEFGLTDPATDRPAGIGGCAVMVERDDDPALAELFTMRSEIAEQEFFASFGGFANWTAWLCGPRREALLRLEMLVRTPRPSVHRFLLLASANRGALAMAAAGEAVLLVPHDVAVQASHIGAYQVLSEALPAGEVRPADAVAIKAALAVAEAPPRPNRRERRAAAKRSRCR
jgi:hypothetical protein